MNRFLLFVFCIIKDRIVAMQWLYAFVVCRKPVLSYNVLIPEFLFHSAVEHKFHHLSFSESHFFAAKYQNQ